MNLKYLFYGAIVATTLQLKSAEDVLDQVKSAEDVLDQGSWACSDNERLEFLLYLSGLPKGNEERQLHDAYFKALERKDPEAQKEKDRLCAKLNALQEETQKNLAEKAEKALAALYRRMGKNAPQEEGAIKAEIQKHQQFTAALANTLEPNKGPRETSS